MGDKGMTRALALPARQVTALCKGAAKAGYVAEVKIGDVVIRLVPAANSQERRPIDRANDDGDLDAELAAFEARHGDG